MKKTKYWAVLLLLCLSAIGCSNLPEGAVAGCGEFDYAGSFTNSNASGKALWLSDSELASKLSVEDVTNLAEALGCND